MMDMIRLLVANIPALFLFAVAAYTALQGFSGWGWFLFVGLLVSHYIKSD